MLITPSRRPSVGDRRLSRAILRASREQQIVEQTWVVQGQDIQLVRHGKHDMEVVGGQKFSFSGRQPALARLCLALWAVAISAGVIGDVLVATLRARIHVATQRCGAASLNSTKGFMLLKVEARSIPIEEAVALRA